jgi:Lrp/AsnC family transcriptional regulator, leucine-responsive regulatory protein
MKKSQPSKEPPGFPSEKPSRVTLDAIDRRILRVLQRDSLIGNQELAEQIGLSPPACLKRVRRLRDAGVIERTVAILSPRALDYPLLTVVRLKLDDPLDEAKSAFETRVAGSPRVMQCLLVAGEIDYILLVRSRDVAHYQDFARRMLRAAPIRSYTSEIVLEINKATTELPVDPV